MVQPSTDSPRARSARNGRPLETSSVESWDAERVHGQIKSRDKLHGREVCVCVVCCFVLFFDIANN